MKLKDFFIKHIPGSITKEESVEFEKLLEHPENKKEFEHLLKDYHDLNLSLTENDVPLAYNNLLKQIEAIETEEQTEKSPITRWYRYAAIILVFIGLGWFLKDLALFNNKTETLIPIDEAITLKLENGEIKSFDLSKQGNIINTKGQILGIQNTNSLEVAETGESLAYNLLSVPRGKQFILKLPDGSTINLNSESTIKFPSSFSNSEKREVFLTGEAYFNVAHNEDKPFILHTQNLDIRVLGTQFNVESYEENNLTEVVLVEGAVALQENNNQSNSATLSPNQIGRFKHGSATITVNEVKTYLYTSWVNGKLIFRNEKFNDILKALERSFNIEIANSNQHLGNEVFNATFNNETIQDILSYFKETHNIDYYIKNNTVYIN